MMSAAALDASTAVTKSLPTTSPSRTTLRTEPWTTPALLPALRVTKPQLPNTERIRARVK